MGFVDALVQWQWRRRRRRARLRWRGWAGYPRRVAPRGARRRSGCGPPAGARALRPRTARPAPALGSPPIPSRFPSAPSSASPLLLRRLRPSTCCSRFCWEEGARRSRRLCSACLKQQQQTMKCSSAIAASRVRSLSSCGPCWRSRSRRERALRPRESLHSCYLLIWDCILQKFSAFRREQKVWWQLDIATRRSGYCVICSEKFGNIYKDIWNYIDTAYQNIYYQWVFASNEILLQKYCYSYVERWRYVSIFYYVSVISPHRQLLHFS